MYFNSSDEDMRELLRQIQRTTALLAERLSSSQGTLWRPPLTVFFFNPLQPCHAYRTTSTRWWPYHSTSASPSCQESSTRENGKFWRILQDFIQPYNTNPESVGYKGKHLKRKSEIPWNHYFYCLSEPGSNFLSNLEDTRLYFFK